MRLYFDSLFLEHLLYWWRELHSMRHPFFDFFRVYFTFFRVWIVPTKLFLVSIFSRFCMFSKNNFEKGWPLSSGSWKSNFEHYDSYNKVLFEVYMTVYASIRACVHYRENTPFARKIWHFVNETYDFWNIHKLTVWEDDQSLPEGKPHKMHKEGRYSPYIVSSYQ